MKTIFVKPQSVEKKWYLIDAEGKNLGRVAVAAARILRGKNKPEYVPHQDMGDNVIIINAAKASVTGNKVLDKKYYRHSMFPGGLTTESYGELIERKPTFPMENSEGHSLPISGYMPVQNIPTWLSSLSWSSFKECERWLILLRLAAEVAVHLLGLRKYLNPVLQRHLIQVYFLLILRMEVFLNIILVRIGRLLVLCLVKVVITCHY